MGNKTLKKPQKTKTLKHREKYYFIKQINLQQILNEQFFDLIV